jgi:hypothetical protein
LKVVKFRAWSEARKCYEMNCGLNDGQPIRKGYQWFSTDNDVLHSTPEQFTGLQDANGRDIYEGDIMRHVDIDEYVDERSEKVIVTVIQPLEVYINTMTWIPKHGEVIGNIHENGDLIS